LHISSVIRVKNNLSTSIILKPDPPNHHLRDHRIPSFC